MKKRGAGRGTRDECAPTRASQTPGALLAEESPPCSARLSRPSPLAPRPSLLSRQITSTHQILVHRPRALPSFADRPHDERLPPTHVAGREHLVDRRPVVVGVGLHVAACIAVDTELLEKAGRRR